MAVPQGVTVTGKNCSLVGFEMVTLKTGTRGPPTGTNCLLIGWSQHAIIMIEWWQFGMHAISL